MAEPGSDPGDWAASLQVEVPHLQHIPQQPQQNADGAVQLSSLNGIVPANGHHYQDHQHQETDCSQPQMEEQHEHSLQQGHTADSTQHQNQQQQRGAEPDLQMLAQQLTHLDQSQLGYSAPMYAQQLSQQQVGESLQPSQTDFLTFQMHPQPQPQHFEQAGPEQGEEVDDVDIMRIPVDSHGMPIPAAQHLEQQHHHHMDLHDQLAELAAHQQGHGNEQQHHQQQHPHHHHQQQQQQQQQLQAGNYATEQQQQHQQHLGTAATALEVSDCQAGPGLNQMHPFSDDHHQHQQQYHGHQLQQLGQQLVSPHDTGLAVPEDYVALGQAKTCRLCHVVRMLDQYHVNNSNADKHDTRCKACCAEYEKLKRAKKKRIHEPTVSEKQCRCCEEVKPATAFYRYTYSKDGLYQQCKACHARAGEIRLSRQGDPESKVCSKCNEEKPKSDFYVSKYLSSGLHSQCKRCVRVGQEKKTRCNPEDAAPSKVCRRCRMEKPALDFFWNKLVSDGLSTYCRSCSATNSRTGSGGISAGDETLDVEAVGAGGGSRLGNRAEGMEGLKAGRGSYNNIQPTKDHKHCKKCNITKSHEDFYHIKNSSDGLASNCKDCAVKIANMTRKHYHEEPTVQHKECKLCKEVKAAEDFYRNRTNADGLFGKCKKCSDSQAEANRKPRIRHNVAEPTVTEKECTKCQMVKPQAEFNRDKTKADGLQFRCKACVHEYMRKRRRADATRRQEHANAAADALAANNLAVLAQAAEPGGILHPLEASINIRSSSAMEALHLPSSDSRQHVQHMDQLQAALDAHQAVSLASSAHESSLALPLLPLFQQPAAGSPLQLATHPVVPQEPMPQVNPPQQPLQGEVNAAPLAQQLQPQQEAEGHAIQPRAQQPEDDAMGSITLDGPNTGDIHLTTNVAD